MSVKGGTMIHKVTHQRRKELLMKALPLGVSKTKQALAAELGLSEYIVSMELRRHKMNGAWFEFIQHGKKDWLWFATKHQDRGKKAKAMEREIKRIELEKELLKKEKQERHRQHLARERAAKAASAIEQAKERRRMIAVNKINKELEDIADDEHKAWMQENLKRIEQKQRMKSSLARV